MICASCSTDKFVQIAQEEQSKFVLVEYGWRHRPGTGEDGFGSWLVASESWIKVPNDTDGAYTATYYFVEKFSRNDCKEKLAERLQDAEFTDYKDCKTAFDTCRIIDENIVTSKGYLDLYSEFHCVPYDTWTEFAPSIEHPDRDWRANPNEFGKIKKCSDYRADRLFVCEEQGK
jgi:hypothetical protein